MQNNVSSFTVCFPFDSEVLLQIHSRLWQFIVFSRKNMQFTEIIYHRKNKNQGGLPPCKHRRCVFNQKHHPYSRLVLRSLGEGGREKTSSVFICSADYAVTSKRSDFTHHSEPLFELKISEFRCEIKF